MRRLLSVLQSAIGLLVLALMLAPLIGLPIYLEIAGQPASGIVIAKRENIDILSDTWARRLFVTARYQPVVAQEPAQTEIAVDAATYDALRVGAPVQLRYVAISILREVQNVVVARLESQGPLGWLVALLGTTLIGYLIGIAVFVALIAVWNRRKQGWLALAIFALMIGCVLFVGSGWPLPAPAGPQLGGQARVRALHQVDKVWGGQKTPAEDAVQPYQIVELELTPAGRADPVVAVDMVDAGSVQGLERGATVTVHYSVADPRWARIDGAARTYYWKNLRSFGIIALIAVILLVGLRARTRRRRASALASRP